MNLSYNYLKTFNFKTINNFIQELLIIGFFYSTSISISYDFFNIKNINIKNIFEKKYINNRKSFNKLNINRPNNSNFFDWLSIHNKFLFYFDLLCPYSNSLYDLFYLGSKGTPDQIFQLLQIKGELTDMLSNKLN